MCDYDDDSSSSSMVIDSMGKEVMTDYEEDEEEEDDEEYILDVINYMEYALSLNPLITIEPSPHIEMMVGIVCKGILLNDSFQCIKHTLIDYCKKHGIDYTAIPDAYITEDLEIIGELYTRQDLRLIRRRMINTGCSFSDAFASLSKEDFLL
jgi:hypothetical protein